ncbi:MAG: hypothetical protein ABIF71_14675 [Planctomycetota bacterium]
MRAMMIGSLVLLLVLVTLPALSGQEPAVPAPPTAEGPQKVMVGIYILNMGKLDVATGSFTVDFYLDLKSDRPIPETFEFMNGRASKEKILDEARDGQYEKYYRVLAGLASPIDFKRFPFDGQTLQILIEDTKLTTAELVFVPKIEESGFDPSVNFPGWQITDSKPTVALHEYKVYGETYSQYVFNVDIARIKFNSFLKTFIPVLLTMLIMVSSFILNPAQIVTRLATISSALVASAMFHVSIAGQIPPVGYLTFADKFMMLTYLILLVSFGLNISIFVLQGKQREDLVKKLNNWSNKIVFAGVPLLYVALFLFVK